MTSFHLSEFEQEIINKMIIKQINYAIVNLHNLQNELQKDHQFSDEEMLFLTLLLVYINKCF
ncbi:MAG: hypothetical protein HZR80_20905 [Candidatus Heimdallarchaeota archaeon]